jgi:RNA polymerase sigma-70 factor (ECF subfamily)
MDSPTPETAYSQKTPDELVSLAQEGSDRAFAELVRRYRGRIYALGLHMTGRASDADDITQDAFLRAYSKLDTFQGKSQFFTWLYRIALYRALNIRRSRKRRRSVDIDDVRVEAAVSVDGLNPLHIAEMRQEYAQLLDAFDRLSPTLSTTVALTTLQGLSHREAAVVLDTSEGTIAWRVHEARKRLREDMKLSAAGVEPRPRRGSGRYKKLESGVLVEIDRLLSAG